jgi:hypothetical protein
VLYVDDSRAGEHQQAFNNAANRFWHMHRGENFFMWFNGVGAEGLRMSVRADGEAWPEQLMVQITDDPEGSILTALDGWWLGRQGRGW